jgi:hypothetical protein
MRNFAKLMMKLFSFVFHETKKNMRNWKPYLTLGTGTGMVPALMRPVLWSRSRMVPHHIYYGAL